MRAHQNWKKKKKNRQSLDLATNIISIFFPLANFDLIYIYRFKLAVWLIVFKREIIFSILQTWIGE